MNKKPSEKNYYYPGKIIHVHDKMQSNYSYVISKPYADMSDHPEFQPELTPKQMLQFGIFEGKYMNDCVQEFPKEWFQEAYKRNKLSIEDGKPHVEMNYFKIKSRQSLQEWRRKHWIYEPDVRGWFQWYCRFYIGRRIPDIDKIQIGRWRAFRRHKGAIQKHCAPNEKECRPRQRQALLQWAYSPFF